MSGQTAQNLAPRPKQGPTEQELALMTPEDRAAYEATLGGAIGPNGKPLDRFGRANQLLGQNILDAQANQDLVNGLGVDDYSYQAQLDRGPGYSLTDRVTTLSPAEQLQYATQDQALNMRRTDTTGLDAQKSLLGQYGSILAQGGLDAADRARIAESQQIRGAQARGAEGAILADQAEKGRMGGNAQFLSRLQAQQGATNARAMDDLQTQALGLERRNALMAQQGQVAGQIQTAQDAIDQFNTLGERDRIAANIARENASRDANFNEQNRRDSANMDATNRASEVQFAADSDRSSSNTDRTNAAAQFNVSPGQGARGMTSDRLAASGALQNARMNAVGPLLEQQQFKEGQKGAKTQAWISAIAGLGGAAVNGAGAALGKPPT